MKKTVYYEDELNDDFAGTNINGVEIGADYKYVHKSFLWRAVSFLLYYLVAFPIVWFIERIVLGVRFVNLEAVRKYGDKPFFLYGNHTAWFDAFTPCLISLPRRNKTLVSSDAVSIFGLKTIVEMLGAIPVPTSYRGMRGFMNAVDYHYENSNITVYPEAHIWPYYTGVRPFSDASFAHALRNKAPVFAFFTAYTKPTGLFAAFRRASITVYVSDPIFPDEGLGEREARRSLRDKVYNYMLECSKYSDYEVYEYKRRESN